MPSLLLYSANLFRHNKKKRARARDEEEEEELQEARIKKTLKFSAHFMFSRSIKFHIFATICSSGRHIHTLVVPKRYKIVQVFVDFLTLKFIPPRF